MGEITAALSSKIEASVIEAREGVATTATNLTKLDTERAIQNGLRNRLAKCLKLTAELDQQLQDLLVDSHKEFGTPNGAAE